MNLITKLEDLMLFFQVAGQDISGFFFVLTSQSLRRGKIPPKLEFLHLDFCGFKIFILFVF